VRIVWQELARQRRLVEELVLGRCRARLVERRPKPVLLGRADPWLDLGAGDQRALQPVVHDPQAGHRAAEARRHVVAADAKPIHETQQSPAGTVPERARDVTPVQPHTDVAATRVERRRDLDQSVATRHEIRSGRYDPNIGSAPSVAAPSRNGRARNQNGCQYHNRHDPLRNPP
jgi:hypothetical protein